MASTRRRRRANTVQAANFGQPIQQTVRRSSGRRSSATINRGGAFNAFLNAGNACIAEMQRYNIPGIDKMKATCSEIAQGLVGAHAFTGVTTPTTSRAAVSSTSSPRVSRGGRRSRRSASTASGGVIRLSKPQQQLLNACAPGEQCAPASICQRTGMTAANVARCLTALKKKGYMQSSGRGANALWWKTQQPLAMTGT